MDGRSLLPLVADPQLTLGRDLLVERGPGAGTFAAVRAPRYLYAEYGNGEQELYDLARDPYELESRHADPAYASVKADWRSGWPSCAPAAASPAERGPEPR